MKRLVILYIVGSIMFLLTSCSSNWHLKQAAKKDPSLLDSTKITLVDTVFIQPDSGLVTIPVDTVWELDTIFEPFKGGDCDSIIEALQKRTKRAVRAKKILSEPFIYSDSVLDLVVYDESGKLKIDYKVHEKIVYVEVEGKCPPTAEIKNYLIESKFIWILVVFIIGLILVFLRIR